MSYSNTCINKQIAEYLRIITWKLFPWIPKKWIVSIRDFVGVFQCVAVPISCFTTCKTGDSQPTAMADFRTPALSSSNTYIHCIQWKLITMITTVIFLGLHSPGLCVLLQAGHTVSSSPVLLPPSPHIPILLPKRKKWFLLWSDLRRSNTRRHHIILIVLCKIKLYKLSSCCFSMHSLFI